MSLKISFAAAAALIGVTLFAAPASAVMQLVPMPDPNAQVADTPPDGLFDKSFSNHWQKSSTNGRSGSSTFHFTSSGSTTGFGTSGTSATDMSKQPGSEFYQPMQGTSYPDYH
jgi:hypothetical protein